MKKLGNINLNTLENEGTGTVTSRERRKFLKLGLAITGVYAGGKLLSVRSILGTANAATGGCVEEYDIDMHYSMMIRQALCIDCEQCMSACVKTNKVPEYGYRTRILTRRYRRAIDKPAEFIPVLCNQCNDAPCTRACPTKATYKNPDNGIVMMDDKKCIGCKSCMLACPYDARYFNAEKRAVDKCDFCYESRLSKGMSKTACSSACPTGARTFGNLSDPDDIVYQLVHQIEEAVWVIRPEDDTKPNVFYMKGTLTSVDKFLRSRKLKSSQRTKKIKGKQS